jgi:hypothetical protein
MVTSEYSDHVYCDSCANDNLYTCCKCGSIAEKDAPDGFGLVTDDHNGEDYCNDCWHEYWSECEDCGESRLHDDLYLYNDLSFCEECYEQIKESEGEEHEEAV